MKKTAIFTATLIGLLLSLCAYGQVQTRTLYNFCKCDYSAADNNRTISINSEYDIQVISNSKDVIVFKQFQLDSNSLPKIDFEFIRIEADTFLFVDYDTYSCFSKTIGQGLVYFGSTTNYIDTVTHMNPNTYELTGEIDLIYYRELVKHGQWTEITSSRQASGYYMHGKKQGTWEEYAPDLYSWKKLTYHNGILLDESEANRALDLSVKNVKEVDSPLQAGTWFMSSDSDSILTFDRKGHGRTVKFGSDGSMTFYENHSVVKRYWEIRPQDKTLVIEGESYKFLWLREDYIEMNKQE